MWKSLIETLEQEAEFSAPVSKAQIDNAEAKLNITFPQALKDCLLESNGILGKYGLDLIWSIEQIVSTNVEFRANEDFKELYMPFDSLFFFADAGNGDQFAFPIQAGEIRRPDIFVWNHEDDSRTWIAPNLEKYVVWLLEGKISV
jgi:hypothetical protein